MVDVVQAGRCSRYIGGLLFGPAYSCVVSLNERLPGIEARTELEALLTLMFVLEIHTAFVDFGGGGHSREFR